MDLSSQPQEPLHADVPAWVLDGEELYKRLSNPATVDLRDARRLQEILNAHFQSAKNGERELIARWIELLSERMKKPESTIAVESSRKDLQRRYQNTFGPKKVRKQRARKSEEEKIRGGKKHSDDEPINIEPYATMAPIDFLQYVVSYQRNLMPEFFATNYPCLLPLARAFAGAKNLDEALEAVSLLRKYVVRNELPARAAKAFVTIIGAHRNLPSADRIALFEVFTVSTRPPEELEEDSEDETFACEAWLEEQERDQEDAASS